MDVKLENIVVTKDEEPILIDFGASKLGRSDRIHSRYQASTIYCMPPEMHVEGNHTFDGKCADVFAFGATILASLTQQLAFEKATRFDQSYSHVLKDDW